MRILIEVTQGKIFWDATATRIVGEEDWEICFKYSDPPGWTNVLEWCTTASDPQPPGPGPGPPPVGWSEDFFGQEWFLTAAPAGSPNCWNTIPDLEPAFFPSPGPWGCFAAIFSSSGIGDVLMEVYPEFWVPSATTWRVDWSVSGGGSGSRTAIVAPGFLPTFFFTPGEIGDCPGSILTLQCQFAP